MSAPPRSATHQSVANRIEIAGRSVNRVAFGAARLTAGDGWGVPRDIEASRDILRSAIDAGVTYVDTADSLGPGVSESIIGDVVGNSSDVLVATKVGMLRPGPSEWDVLGHPNYLRQQVHSSLFRLRRDRIDLLYLHRIDPNYPVADQVGALQDLRDQGLVAHIGVSSPTRDQLEDVLALEPKLAAVQSLFNVAAADEKATAVRLAEAGIPFVAYWPLVGRGLPKRLFTALFDELARIGSERNISATDVALAWIFATLPNSIAVVGSRSREHFAQNLSSAEISLSDEEVGRVNTATQRVLAGFTFDPRYSKDHA